MSKPIALSCGEPAGIGPEIAAAAWQILRGALPFVWLGDPRHLPDGTPWRAVSCPDQAAETSPEAMPVLASEFGPPRIPGQPNPAHAPHVVRAIDQAVKLVQNGLCSAVCTAPIHKQALMDGAAFAHPGHTEYLAHLAGVEQVVMMLACPGLRVVPATVHIPLSEVPEQLTKARLTTTIEITHKAMVRDFGLPAPRIALTGLNPHAGEGGKMGPEEEALIRPVIEAFRSEGMAISGPWPADTMFHKAARENYDVAIAMYHDQALIPIKTIDFARGVNVTLGLPFVRTSPDHGTAFDIAGRGIADPTSLIEALTLAGNLAKAQA